MILWIASYTLDGKYMTDECVSGVWSTTKESVPDFIVHHWNMINDLLTVSNVKVDKADPSYDGQFHILERKYK